MHDAAATVATISVEGGKARKIRQDQKTLHTVIASHPYMMTEIRDDPAKRAEAAEWEKRTIDWLRSLYANDLKSVIRHEDESHFHIHAYIVPTSDPELKALRYHPGVVAKRAAMAAGPADGENTKALHKQADAAYKGAMRIWQDSYHEAVGIPCGLARLGPRRRSLTRAEWQAEKTQAKALQLTVERAREVKASGDQYISRVKSETAAIRAAADQEKQAAVAAKAAAEREKEIAAKVKAAAIAERDRAAKQQEQASALLTDARRYSGWAGRFRALWDGLRKSKIANRIRQEFASETERLSRLVQQKQRQLDGELEQRRLAEQSAREARQAAEMATFERDQAKSILSRLQSSLEPEAAHHHVTAPSLQLKPSLRPKFTAGEKPRA
ncbi:hypothetical protein PH547_04190 [Rhizobium sp. CNPSo 3464]|uniref:hypothetical protein n=1 Tax=Rhizobium sp. CNPSo 3464 TaxID=3021406 RepID=UPI0025507AED|nr:hypothetical protein [Rhizobium sp. CNPSo 3464]MDK4738064.1 hypothetical protein [Rhizobium sp. CNPSo 3464]